MPPTAFFRARPLRVPVDVPLGADGSPHWSRVWPTPEDNPRHAGLEFWMASYGYQILSRPASWSGWCEG